MSWKQRAIRHKRIQRESIIKFNNDTCYDIQWIRYDTGIDWLYNPFPQYNIKFKTLIGKTEMIDVKIDQNPFLDLYN